MCVQLVEYENNSPDSPYLTLQNIYSTMPGVEFCSAHYTRVIYHCTNPPVFEEIKIRLPNVLTTRHALRFAVYHVHVKPKQGNSSILGRITGNAMGSDGISLLVGEGFLNLISPSESFIANEERFLALSLTKDDAIDAMVDKTGQALAKGRRGESIAFPGIRFRTRLHSSLVSTCPYVQRFLNYTPKPLGLLPSSRMIPELANFEPECPPITEALVNECTMNLHSAAPAEVLQHFLLIMRHIMRVMCGGAGVQVNEFMNPFNHPPTRCTAFLSLLQCLGKVAPDVYKIRDKNSPPGAEDFLVAYVDYLFDEEVPSGLAPQCRSSSMMGKEKSASDAEAVDVEENMAAFIAFQIERILIESLLNSALLKAVDEVGRQVVMSKLLSLYAPTRTMALITSPFKANRHREINTFTDLTKGIELRVRSRRLSGAMLNLRKFLPMIGSINHETEIIVEEKKDEYDVLDGYASRMGLTGTQWWPFLYEVLVEQWISVLCVLQGKEPIIFADTSGAPICDMKYPFSLAALSNPNDSSKDTRVLLQDHSPFLFRLITKSLGLRIYREGKRTPVVLDNVFLKSLETLVELISEEAATRLSSGLTRSRRLNLALAQFLRRLFALVTPIQVSQLITAYFRREKSRRAEEIGLRLQVVEDLGSFDHFVSVNFPSHLDSALVNPRRPSTFTSKMKFNLRGVIDPPSHWLAHICIEEVMFAYRQQDTALTSIRVLRDLLVRHSYDARHQDLASRQRIAVMYIPLLFQILAESERLSLVPFDAPERRELLAILLYLLQDLPERQLREQWRQLTLKDASALAAVTQAAGVTVRRASNSVVPVHELPILRLLKLLHLVLDTFDYPYDRPDDPIPAKILVPGIAQSSRDITGTKTISGAADHLRNLDELMYRKKAVSVGITSANNERRWAKQVRNNRSTTNIGSSTISDPIFLRAAAKGISHESTLIVLKTLTTVLEEVPGLLLEEQKGDIAAFDDLMSLCVSLLLHGLVSRQSELVILALLEQTRLVLKRFGASVFTKAADDSLQDWLRRIFLLCSYPGAVMRHQACDVLLLLFQSSFYHGVSLTLLKVTSLAVFQDVLDAILDTYGSKIDSVEREDEFLSYLRSSIVHMRDSAPIDLLGDQSKDLHALHAHIFAFMDSLDKLLAGNACLRRHVNLPVGHDWSGANLLDGPFEHVNHIILKSRQDRVRANASRPVSSQFNVSTADSPKVGTPVPNSRKAVTVSQSVTIEQVDESGSDTSEATAILQVKFDVEAVMELFVEVSELFDPILLPRFRMRWLENLARLHDSKQNRGESAEVRWRIFNICEKVRFTWDQVWAPREPLQWTGDGPEAAKGSRNFLQLFYGTLASPGKWWSSQMQLREHMETCLSTASSKFASVSLFHLAERSYHSLLSIYRQEGKLADMNSVYQSIANMFKAHLSSSFAMGLFYRVYFMGKGKLTLLLCRIGPYLCIHIQVARLIFVVLSSCTETRRTCTSLTFRRSYIRTCRSWSTHPRESSLFSIRARLQLRSRRTQLS